MFRKTLNQDFKKSGLAASARLGKNAPFLPTAAESWRHIHRTTDLAFGAVASSRERGLAQIVAWGILTSQYWRVLAGRRDV